jgi:hypothetical protein
MDIVTEMRRSFVGCGLLDMFKVYTEGDKELPFARHNLNLGAVKIRE